MITNINTKQIADEIIEMAKKDQEYIKTYGHTSEEFKKVNLENTKRATEIINEVGLISIPEYGEEASQSMWLLVQHFPDESIGTMQKYIDLMGKSLDKVNKRNYAFLYDRIRVKKKLPQRYGTQVAPVDQNKTREFESIEDVKNVDKLRAEMGLESLEWYQDLMQEGEDYTVKLPLGYK